jgi:WD40 repeat protein/tRNA A-37 threonylcarbamoyl transferase component Bud32
MALEQLEPVGPGTPLGAFLMRFLDAADHGLRADPRELLERHPELGPELNEFLAAYEEMEGLAAPLRWVASMSSESAFAAGDTSRPGDDITAAATGPAPGGGPTVRGYELLGRIARGGMGVVYKARQVFPNRLVALKMIRTGRLGDHATRLRFRNEAETAAALEHPNIVPVYEVGETDGQLFFSMKLLEGGTLRDHLRKFVDDPRGAAGLLAKVARAVAYAHRKGVLHRDLKPSNILLDADCRPHVGDFGLAKRVDDDSELTRAGDMLGTPSYMAPEQTYTERRGGAIAAGSSPEGVTTASDVYGLGAVLYALLTGRPPFAGPTPYDTVEQVRHSAPVPPRVLNRRAHRDLETVCLKCLEKRPTDRYPSADDVADDLERWLDGKPVEATRPSSFRRLVMWARRHKGWAALAAAVTVFVPALVATLATTVVIVGRARAVAEDRGNELRRQLYAADMALGHRAWLTGDFTALDRVLDRWRPGAGGDAPDFAWRLLDAARRGTDVPRPLEDRAHAGAVFHVALSPDGRTLASASADGTVRLRTAGGPPRWLRGHHGDVNWVSFSGKGDLLATAGDDGTVRVWDASSLRQRLLLSADAGEATAAEFTPDGRTLVTGWQDGSVRLWDLPSGAAGRMVRDPNGIRAHDQRVEGLSINRDGDHLITGAGDELMRHWSLKTGELHFFRRTRGPCSAVCFSPGGNWMAMGDGCGCIRVYDLGGGGCRGVYQCDDGGRVEGLAFSPNDLYLVSCGGRGCVRLWDLRTQTLRATMICGNCRPWSVAISPDGEQLYCGADDGIVRTWDFAKAGVPRHLRGNGGACTIAISADSRTLAVVEPDESVSLRDLATGAELPGAGRLRYGGKGSNAVCFGGEGSKLGLAGLDGGLKVWSDAIPPRPLTQLPSVRQPPSDASPFAVPNWFCRRPGSTEWDVCVNESPMIRWDAANGQMLPPYFPGKECRSVTWSPDGSTLAARVAGEVRVLRTATETEINLALEPKFGAVQAVTFSPDGKTIATGGVNGSIELWEIAAGSSRSALPGHPTIVGCLAFSPDGHVLASGGADGAVKLWHLSTGRELFTLQVLDDGDVNQIEFSPDGQYLVAAYTCRHCWSGVAIWRASPP